MVFLYAPGVTAVTLGLLHITQLLESFEILKYGFFSIGGALSSISFHVFLYKKLESGHSTKSFLISQEVLSILELKVS